MPQPTTEKKTRRHVADVMYDTASRMASTNTVQSTLSELPALSLYAFVTSIMTLGSRILKMGKIELGMAQMMSWQRPAFTLSVLSFYSVLCYHPQWIVILPLFYFTFFVLIPNYAQKFKMDDAAAEVEVDPLLFMPINSEEEKKKNSRNLLTAVKQGQKSLTNIVATLDKFDEFRNGPARFVDAPISVMLLVGLMLLLVLSAWALSFVSVPLFFSICGWALVCSKHPLAKLTTEKLEEIDLGPQIDMKTLYAAYVRFCRTHVLLDEKPLQRVVEIYELQPQGLTSRHWDSLHSVYSTSPYVLSSPHRIQKERPAGCTKIEDVLPPNGWYFDLTDDWVCDEDAWGWASINGLSDVTATAQWAYDVPDGTKPWRRCRWTRSCYCDLN